MLLIALFIWWTSPQPIDPATQQLRITGGAIQSMTVSADGRSGSVWIVASRECTTIDWSARTISGGGLRTLRAWRDECEKVYLPV